MSKFCQECGKKLADNAMSCPKCGYSFNGCVTIKKSKTTAILLAVFLGLWSWLYTYKTDMWKFWLNLVLCVFTLGLWGFVAWVWVIIDQSTKSNDYYENY